MGSEPWKNVSAAIGIARFDPAADRCMDDVLKRADTTMYDMKKAMRAQRQD
jgi:GGDEF domain-containing protein